jgi:hypothetical protein
LFQLLSTKSVDGTTAVSKGVVVVDVEKAAIERFYNSDVIIYSSALTSLDVNIPRCSRDCHH